MPKKMQSWRYMQDKLEYSKPSITVSKFSIDDVIRVSSVTPCPTGDDCKGDNGACIDSYATCTEVT